MCVAYPGTVILTNEDGGTATVDFGGTTLTAKTGYTGVQPGDHVLIHAGYVLQVLRESDAAEMEEIFREIAEMEETGKSG